MTNRHERRMHNRQQRRLKPLKRRRFTFDNQVLDEFEVCEAERIAGADSEEAHYAGAPEYYAWKDRSLDLQLKLLLHLPCTGAACGGVFNTEPPQPGDHVMEDREFFLDVRQQLFAALEERKRRRER
jgi:hypothetical protein